ncbi:30S ribosomal protein S6 [Candidatus Neomarinimicrobiota bacterium]
MRYYEAIYIVHPNLEDEGLTKLVNETKDMLKKREGEVVYEEVLGKKRLAYSIQRQRFGTYVLLQFRGDGSGNARLNQDLELHDDILAHMIVRIDEDEVRGTSEEKAEISEDTSAKVEQKDEADEVVEVEESEMETAGETTEAEAEAAAEETTADEDTSSENEELEPEEEK